jgi:hypothetical protein
MSLVRINYQNMMDQGNQLLKIEQLIETKRNMLLEKQKKLRFISKQNAFLGAVKEDYDKYNNYIIKQREDQMKALQVLNYYLDDLSRTGKLTKANIKDSKFEQRKIVEEIKKVQENLNGLLSETNVMTFHK